MNLTTQQLADILIGIARSQQALVDAIESSRAGFKGTYLAPALEGAAKIRTTGRTPTLQDFPARILLQCQARGGPNAELIVKDLEALLSGQVSALSAVAPATARVAARSVAPAPAAAPSAAVATTASPSVPADDDLDMTK